MLLYAGPFVAFTVLVLLSGRLPHLARWHVVRTYRAWGVGLGLSMGTWVLGLLVGHYLRTGAFTWGWGSAAEQWTLATHAVFLLLWAFNVRVEVWSLEPLRKLDREAPEEDGRGAPLPDDAAFATATASLGRNMAVQSVLLLTYVVLQSLGG